MNASDPIAAIGDAGVIAVLRAPSAETAIRAVDALVEGGVTGIEITFSTPCAAAVICAVRERYGDDVLLGAGTVLAPQQATEAVDAGAAFLVSPGLDDELIGAMLSTHAATLVGALTPTEMMRAIRAGVDAVKLFPGSLVGPEYLRAVRGPFAQLSAVPTGGVSPDNMVAWFTAGALAVGAGSELVSTADMAAGRWDVIRGNAERFRLALEEARATLRPL